MNRPIPTRRSLLIKGGVAAATAASALTLGGIVVAEKHHYPNASDSFVKYQVDSTSELVEALRKDETLRRRYARHFGIPENQVIEFVKSALVPYKLPADRMVTTYGISKSGRIYGVRTRMRKGTKVWANRSGVPILKWLCANPLTKTLPGTKMAKARPTKVKPKTRVAGARSLAPITADTEMPVTEAPLPALTPQIRTALTTSTVPTSLAGPTPAAGLTPPTVARSGDSLGMLFPVGLILLSTLTGGGSGGTGGAGSPEGPPIVVPPAAPEPGTLALLLPILGSVGAGGIIRRKQRRRGCFGSIQGE